LNLALMDARDRHSAELEQAKQRVSSVNLEDELSKIKEMKDSLKTTLPSFDENFVTRIRYIVDRDTTFYLRNPAQLDEDLETLFYMIDNPVPGTSEETKNSILYLINLLLKYTDEAAALPAGAPAPAPAPPIIPPPAPDATMPLYISPPASASPLIAPPAASHPTPAPPPPVQEISNALVPFKPSGTPAPQSPTFGWNVPPPVQSPLPRGIAEEIAKSSAEQPLALEDTAVEVPNRLRAVAAHNDPGRALVNLECENTIKQNVVRNPSFAFDEIRSFIVSNIPSNSSSKPGVLAKIEEKAGEQLYSLIKSGKVVEYIILPMEDVTGDFTKFGEKCANATHQINIKFISDERDSNIEYVEVKKIGGAKPIMFSFRINLIDSVSGPTDRSRFGPTSTRSRSKTPVRSTASLPAPLPAPPAPLPAPPAPLPALPAPPLPAAPLPAAPPSEPVECPHKYEIFRPIAKNIKEHIVEFIKGEKLKIQPVALFHHTNSIERAVGENATSVHIINPEKNETTGNYDKFGPTCVGSSKFTLTFKDNSFDSFGIQKGGGELKVVFLIQIPGQELVRSPTEITAGRRRQTSKNGRGRKQRTLKRNRKI
jgi:hypothetical protein